MNLTGCCPSGDGGASASSPQGQGAGEGQLGRRGVGPLRFSLPPSDLRQSRKQDWVCQATVTSTQTWAFFKICFY